MRVLLTGGTGFIGSYLVPQLLANGHHLTLLVRESYGSGKPLPRRLQACRSEVELVYADLRNFSLTARAVRQADPQIVYHLAAAGATDPFLSVDAALRHNVNGTVNLLRASFERGQDVAACIVARTPGESSAMNVYAAAKAAAWTFCKMYARTAGWPVTGATIFQAYGPGQPAHALAPAAIEAASRGADFPMTSGQQQRDWIHVRDVAAGLTAMSAAGLEAGESVDIGSGKVFSIREVAEMIYSLIDRGGKVRPGLLPDRPGEAASQQADAERTWQMIGWRASLALPDGLRSMVEKIETS